MRVRIILISMLVMVFAGMLAVHAMALSSAATPDGEEYGRAGDRNLGDVTNPTTPGAGTAVGSGVADTGSAASGANVSSASLPRTGAFLLIPAAGLMAAGMGALMIRKRLSGK